MAEEQAGILEISDDEMPEDLAAFEQKYALESEAEGEPQEEKKEEQEEPKEEEEVEVEKEEPQEEEIEATDRYSKSTEEAEEVEHEQVQEETKDSEVDYKQEYLRLLAPFKANGKEMKVDNVDDARQLMQMGANYNKKMAAMKPHLRILRTLENNGLLNEEKITFLIDLDKKDPSAVTKFIKESGVDPLDLNLDQDIVYKPKAQIISEKEFEVDNVLDELPQDLYKKTVDELGNKWDLSSRQYLNANPAVIRVISSHIENGIYDHIRGVIEKERMFGRLAGLSDLEAYRQVGDALHARGEFKQYVAQQPEPAPKVNGSQDSKIKQRKEAAAPIKGTVSKPKSNFNPLAMSDEEFEKIAMSRYI